MSSSSSINIASATKPYGVIHFLGGAFVGAAPHITYRYLLETLCDQGYLIVATPYRLEMDYIRSCDQILSKFDAVAVDLAAEYGPLPVIGIGHSCGALLQTLITSLFPDTPRAVNVLISFNNRPAAAAIPAFNEIIIPVSEQLMLGSAYNSTTTTSTSSLTGDPASNLRETISNIRSTIETLLDSYAQSSIAPKFVSSELLPLYRQGVEIVDQIPDLLLAIAQGQREFKPSPADTKEVCRRMYRARRTLLIKFENDELDESPDIEKVLREANTIMRMKRPMIEMEVTLKNMTGTHLTPLIQDIDVIFPDPPIPDVLKPFCRSDTVNDGESEAAARVVLYKSTETNPVAEGADFLVSYQVINIGDAAAANIDIADKYDPKSFETTENINEDGNVSFKLEELAPGAQASFNVTVRPKLFGIYESTRARIKYLNSAAVEMEGVDPGHT
eukprot:gene23719-32100_t